MKNSHRFFNNAACEYFPCHVCERPEEFNCLFCFCPLYFLADCGGSPRLTPTGVKDCSGCGLPHGPGGYDHVMTRLRREFARRKAHANDAP